MFFVFAAVLEFALVLLYKRRSDWKKISPKFNETEKLAKNLGSAINLRRNNGIQSIYLTTEEIRLCKQGENTTGTNENSSLLNLQPKQATKMDLVAFITFSLSYFVFNIIYFACFFDKL